MNDYWIKRVDELQKENEALKKQINQLLNGEGEQQEVKSMKDLLTQLENNLNDAKTSYENYQEYEPEVSQLESLGYDDQDMELHSLRKTMNEYYDDYRDAEEQASKITKEIRQHTEYSEEIEDEIENLQEYYMI